MQLNVQPQKIIFTYQIPFQNIDNDNDGSDVNHHVKPMRYFPEISGKLCYHGEYLQEKINPSLFYVKE